jgi:hypothetical protein
VYRSADGFRPLCTRNDRKTGRFEAQAIYYDWYPHRNSPLQTKIRTVATTLDNFPKRSSDDIVGWTHLFPDTGREPQILFPNHSTLNHPFFVTLNHPTLSTLNLTPYSFNPKPCEPHTLLPQPQTINTLDPHPVSDAANEPPPTSASSL